MEKDREECEEAKAALALSVELKQGEIEKLQAEYESLSAKHMESEFGIAALRTEYDGLKSAHDTLALSLEAKQADIEALTAESLERLEAQKKRTGS